jgi:hypothetical protein
MQCGDQLLKRSIARARHIGRRVRRRILAQFERPEGDDLGALVGDQPHVQRHINLPGRFARLNFEVLQMAGQTIIVAKTARGRTRSPQSAGAIEGIDQGKLHKTRNAIAPAAFGKIAEFIARQSHQHAFIVERAGNFGLFDNQMGR